MSVNAGERNVPDTPQNRQLDACWKARGLALHTIKICTNQNIFLPEYQSALTNDLIELAKNIYLKVWRANNIRVKGNSYKLIGRMDNYLNELRKDESNGSKKTQSDTCGSCRG